MAGEILYDVSGSPKLIIGNYSVVAATALLDIQEDVYSQAKLDWHGEETDIHGTPLRRVIFPFGDGVDAVDGGKPIPGGKEQGRFFWLVDDWKFRPVEEDHRLQLDGNVFKPDGTPITVPTLGGYTVSVAIERSSEFLQAAADVVVVPAQVVSVPTEAIVATIVEEELISGSFAEEEVIAGVFDEAGVPPIEEVIVGHIAEEETLTGHIAEEEVIVGVFEDC